MAETTKTYTEREVILCERDAVKRTIEELWADRGVALKARNWVGSDAFAASLYPFPTVKRIRVEKDPHDGLVQWSAQDEMGRLRMMVRVRSDVWEYYPRDGEGMLVTPERVAVWADLFSRPTEFVEDDGSAAASPEGR